jgi:hypothetical protein
MPNWWAVVINPNHSNGDRFTQVSRLDPNGEIEIKGYSTNSTGFLGQTERKIFSDPSKT